MSSVTIPAGPAPESAPSPFPPAGRRDWFPTVLIAAIGIAIVRLWLQRLHFSFWLDEALILWTIRDGAAQIIPHAFVSLQSIPFCLLEWPMSLLGIPAEPALRILPLLAGIGVLFVFHRIGREMLDGELGLIFAALCVTLPAIVREGSDARPYTLALMAHTAALLWLFRWLRNGRLKAGVWWAICAALAGHLHHLFVVAIPLEALAVLWFTVQQRRPLWRQVVICAIGAGVLMLPAVPQALVMLRQSEGLSFATRPAAWELPMMLMPTLLLVLLLFLAVGIRAFGSRLSWDSPIRGRKEVLFAAVLLLVPVCGIFALARLTDIRLFLQRYLLPSAPGLVIAWGWLLRGVQPQFLRRASLLAYVVATTILAGGFSPVPVNQGEDWRAAVKSLPDSQATVLYSGLVETRRLEWLEMPERWSYLAAPLAVYRPSASLRDVVLVPFEIDLIEKVYLERVLTERFADRNAVTVIARHAFSGPQWCEWVGERLLKAGFRLARSSSYGAVDTQVYEREAYFPSTENANKTLPGAPPKLP